MERFKTPQSLKDDKKLKVFEEDTITMTFFIGNPDEDSLGIVKDLLIDQAMNEGISHSVLITRSLIPSDLGVNGRSWNFTVNEGQTTIVDHEIIDDRFIAITGLASLAKIVSQVNIFIGNTLMAVWNIEALQYSNESAGFTTSPVILSANASFRITVDSISDGLEDLAFQGIVVERKGLTKNDGW